MNRRDAVGFAFVGLVAGVVGSTEPANAANNPALQTFKGT